MNHEFQARDGAFATWRQERMVADISGRIDHLGNLRQSIRNRRLPIVRDIFPADTSTIDSAIAVTEEAYIDISSDQFRERLIMAEPWRLHEASVQKGSNLYVNVAKAYAADDFLQWANNIAEQHTTTSDQVIAGVIEAIRKIEWETIKVMAETGVATTPVLPHIVIADKPGVDIELFLNALSIARQEKVVEGLFNKERSMDYLNLRSVIRIQRAMEEEGLRVDVNKGGLFSLDCLGTSVDNSIAIKSSFIANVLGNNDNDMLRQLVTVAVEEEIHHQQYKDKELVEAIDRLRGSLTFDFLSPDPRLTYGHRAEAEVGIKDFVTDVVSNLPGNDELFAPFYNRLEGH